MQLLARGVAHVRGITFDEERRAGTLPVSGLAPRVDHRDPLCHPPTRRSDHVQFPVRTEDDRLAVWSTSERAEAVTRTQVDEPHVLARRVDEAHPRRAIGRASCRAGEGRALA